MRKTTFCLIAALSALMLCTGCAQKPEQDPFAAHWKEQAATRQGHSPSEYDLRPGPRVVMNTAEKGDPAGRRALPAMPVTLKLHNVDVGVALRSLAAAASVNVLISPGVSGSASLNVQKTPWRDVFVSLLRANGLEYRWQGNILQVLTAAEKQKEIQMATLDAQLTRQVAQSAQTGPLGVAVVSIRYADVEALRESLSKFLAGGADAAIEVDKHSNALIVQAPTPVQKRLLALIEHLDQPRPQVRLKAYIVEATKETARELGTKWGGVMQTSADRGRSFWTGGAGAGTVGQNPVTNGYGTAGGMSGQPFGLNYSTIAGGTGAGTLGFMYGTIGGNILDAELNLMEKEGQLNILSSPSITTLDNKMAYTENGEKVPYVSKDDNGDNEVKFEDAVLRLEMTPNVIDAANLKLKVLVKKDEVDTSRSVEGNPYIIKKQTETSLILRSGETMVISGLTKEKGSDVEAGVPGLRKLPAGKYLFGSTNRTRTMEEVLIFITPEILPVRTAETAIAGPLPASPPALASEGWEKGAAKKTGTADNAPAARGGTGAETAAAAKPLQQ